MTELIAAPGRRKVARRKDIRSRLLVAIEELAADGETYSTVTVERLVAVAGISRATFYIYFDGKADLLQTWFGDTLREFAVAAEKWKAIAARPTEAELRAAVDDIVSCYVRHAALLTAVTDESTQNAELREGRNAAIRVAIDSVRQHIEVGQREGWVDPALLPAETAAWLIWMLERGLSQMIVEASRRRVPALKFNFVSMVWHVLYGPTSSAKH